MGKGMMHYTEDGLYEGETHKMDDGSLHTGKTHTKTSKVLSHKRKGPFKMKTPLYKAGMWANIHAKKKRGDTSTDDRPSKKEWDKNTK